MAEGQRDVYLYRRPITSLAKVPFVNKSTHASISHWAVCVGETCYEVTHTLNHPTGKPRDIRTITKSEWIQHAQEKRLVYQYTHYGKCNAEWTDDDIKKCADDIWKRVFDGTYENFESNCQEFAHLLMRCIVNDLRQDTVPNRWESYNPDALVPAAMITGGPGFTAGVVKMTTATAATGAVGGVTILDVATTGGILTGIFGMIAFASHKYNKYRRYKKSKALVAEWHSIRNTTTKKGWRRVFSRSSWRRMWDTI
ncbi:hypothetical protein QC762_0097040 [Podospora pseudocomata]|uniref:LRAT domain-containing protein n=1 Tax=Podospora pseudocomata TaxID=2093779 RepID=A0ABR0G8C5_9PEZI|nr:hypothetical protein QC762_0097040 [Podospora pseudocomata]